MGSFCSELRLNVTDRNGSNGGSHENEFWLFSNTKINSQTIRVEKVNKKNEAIFVALLFRSWVMTFKLFRKVHILQFCADLSKKPKSVKTIYILHLKVLITHFQKMIWFIGVWATVYEILAIKVSKKMLTQPKLKKIWLQSLISPK